MGLSKEREREREREKKGGNRGSDKGMTSSRPPSGRLWREMKALHVQPWIYDSIRLLEMISFI